MRRLQRLTLELLALAVFALGLIWMAGSGEAVDSIAFRYLDDAGADPVRAGQDVEIVYRTALDEYGGARRMQLVSEWLRKLP